MDRGDTRRQREVRDDGELRLEKGMRAGGLLQSPTHPRLAHKD